MTNEYLDTLAGKSLDKLPHCCSALLACISHLLYLPMAASFARLTTMQKVSILSGPAEV